MNSGSINVMDCDGPSALLLLTTSSCELTISQASAIVSCTAVAVEAMMRKSSEHSDVRYVSLLESAQETVSTQRD